MPLVASSAHALVAALLQGVQMLDDAGAPPPPQLLSCAAQLGALYAETAAQGTVRRCARHARPAAVR